MAEFCQKYKLCWKWRKSAELRKSGCPDQTVSIRHCEERSDAAIQSSVTQHWIALLLRFTASPELVGAEGDRRSTASIGLALALYPPFDRLRANGMEGIRLSTSGLDGDRLSTSGMEGASLKIAEYDLNPRPQHPLPRNRFTAHGLGQQAVAFDRTRHFPRAGFFRAEPEKAVIIIGIADHHQRAICLGFGGFKRCVHQRFADALALHIGRNRDGADQYKRLHQRALPVKQPARPALDRAKQRAILADHRKAQPRNRLGPGPQFISCAPVPVRPESRIEQRFDRVRGNPAERNHGDGLWLYGLWLHRCGEILYGWPLGSLGLRAAHYGRCGVLSSFLGSRMQDSLFLEVSDVEVDVLTGIYSEETHLPQPLRISIRAEMKMADHYDPATPLSASKNYMHLKHAATDAIPKDVHFTLIEAVADHIIGTILLQDDKVLSVEVKIVKLAIAEAGESIGITMKRVRQ